jgi:hypothetical protein
MRALIFIFHYPHRHSPVGAPAITDHSNESVNFCFYSSAQTYTCVALLPLPTIATRVLISIFCYPHRHTPVGAPAVTDRSNESVNFIFVIRTDIHLWALLLSPTMATRAFISIFIPLHRHTPVWHSCRYQP